MDTFGPISAQLEAMEDTILLAETIGDPKVSPQERRKAIEEVLKVAAKAPDVSPYIVESIKKALKDSNQWVQAAALITLEKLGYIGPDELDHLIKLLSSPTSVVWPHLPHAIEQCYGEGDLVRDEVYLSLFNCIWHQDECIRRKAVIEFSKLYVDHDGYKSDKVRELNDRIINCIDIEGLPKNLILAELYNSAKSSFPSTPFNITNKEAQEIINLRALSCKTFSAPGDAQVPLFFDHVHYRELGINLTGELLDPDIYDQRYGKGAARDAINRVRALLDARKNSFLPGLLKKRQSIE